MADFSELPEELIDNVMKRLTCIEDFGRSAAVCKSWRSTAATLKTQKQPCFPPSLMLTNDDTDAQNLRTFFCLSRKREFTVKLRDIQGRRCWGSPFGWMVTFGLDKRFHLFNPFSGVRLNLPRQSTFEHQYKRKMPPEYLRRCCPRKFFLSSNPSLCSTTESIQNQSCMVIALCDPHGKLYYAKPGDKAWTAIETPRNWNEDAIYFDGLVYALDQHGMLIVCDIHADHPKLTRIEASPPHDPRRRDTFYLVEISGELHLVVRHRELLVDGLDRRNSHYITKYFHVHKFDFQAKRWIQVHSLGEYALFVGNNASFVILANDYLDLKGNAIYHTDDNRGQFHMDFSDMSIYDLEKKTLEPFYFGTNVLSRFCRPIFIIPSL